MAGVDVGAESIKVVILRCSGQCWQLEAFDHRHRTEGELSLEQQVQGVLSALPVVPARLVIAVPAAQAFLRVLDLPAALSGDDLENWLVLAAPGHLPCPMDEVAIDFYPAQDAGTALLAAIRRDVLDCSLGLFAAGKNRPMIVDLDALALWRAGSPASDNDGGVVADLGLRSLRLHAFQNGLLISSQESEFPALPPLPPHTLQQQVLHEVHRALQVFLASSASIKSQSILLTGGYACLPDLADHLAAHCGLTVTVVDPFRDMTLSQHVDDQALVRFSASLALACGLAMADTQKCLA